MQQDMLMNSMFCQSYVSETNVQVINKIIFFKLYFDTKDFDTHVY